MTQFFVIFLATFAWTCAAFAFDAVEVRSKGGVIAWLVEDKTIPLLAMNFAFDKGTTSDPPGKEGVATFLTGMMDEGAGELSAPEFQAKRDRLAVRLSFDVSGDNLFGSLQTLSRNRSEAFALLRDSLGRPRFEAEPMERMRQYFIQAAQNLEKDPQTIAYQEWLKLAIGQHPYTRPSGGTPQSLQAITRDDLIAAHKSIYTRDNLKISVVGDISVAELAAALDIAFGDLPQNSSESKKVPTATVRSTAATKTVPFDIPQSIVVFGQAGILNDDPNYFPALVMAHILGGQSKSWLYNEVREKRGLTYGVGYSLMPARSAGLYMGWLSTVNEKAGAAVGAVKATLARMAQDGPTQQQLNDAKSYLTGSYALRFDGSYSVANYLLGLMLKGLPIDFANKRNDLVNAVTLEQVKAQASRLLKPDNLIVVAVGRPEGLD